MAQGPALGQQDLAHAGDLRGGLGGGLRALADDQDVHIARQFPGGGDGLVGGVADGVAVAIGDNETGHYRTPAVLSFVTSSAESATLIPAERVGGAVTFFTVRRGAMSTP